MSHQHYIARAMNRFVEMAYLEGDWGSLRHFNDRGKAVVPSESGSLVMEVLLESQLGNIDETGVMLEQYLEALSLSPSGPTTSYARASAMIPFINRISHGADRSDLARKWAETVLASPSVAPLLTFDARVGIALLAVQQDDVTAAREQYAELKSEQGTIWSRVMAAGPGVYKLLLVCGMDHKA